MENELGPATEKQVAFLRKRGIDTTNWTKLKASQEIDKIMGSWNKPQTPGVKETSLSTAPGATSKETSIVAQCLVKAVLGQVDSKVTIDGAVEMYKYAVKLLNE